MSLSIPLCPQGDGGEELRVVVDCMPLKLNVDQDTLLFGIEYAAAVAAEVAAAAEMVPAPAVQKQKPGPDLYFQSFEMKPLRVGIDYKPKRVDYAGLQAGNYAELLNMLPLEGVDITLRSVRLAGLTGAEELGLGVANLWVPDIIRTQLHRYVSGVKPIRSFVKIGGGVADLVLLPVEQYRRDGRLWRGLRRGATSFVQKLTMETLNLGTRLAVGAGDMFATADRLLEAAPQPRSAARHVAGPAVRPTLHDAPVAASILVDTPNPSHYANQPRNTREGLSRAYVSLQDGMQHAGKTIISIPVATRQRGSDGLLRTVFLALPVAVLSPLRGVATAAEKTLLGVQNDLDPRRHMAQKDKYRPGTYNRKSGKR